MTEYDWCELSGEKHCTLPLSKPASRCELCLGCLDPTYHPAPGGEADEYMSGVSHEASAST